ncbi:hypothetical protein HDA40_002497 [Hamadaea flava]|uniref:Uncharacterized protein n=1 Tax=Hamadaea flava TaxID=1742688 RepID=A0ABV8LP23_9ACTN|nr:hypothetical protein [Hamadaea flava]MCP2323990.1 hypothetical protein [Hamadaea flava]
MTTGARPDEVRRWKLIALASAFVAVAAVAGLIGWVARSSTVADAPPVETFTGGGWTLSGRCDEAEGQRLSVGTAVTVLSADGAQLAVGKIVSGPVGVDQGCRQEFLIDGIPGRRGVYLLEVGHWRHPVSEAQLRGNQAELSLIS